MRVGHGYDAHAFVDNCPLVLGGVTIPYKKGLLAHSDGDVVIHAVCDALLGAAALGDIGHWFPDTSDTFRNISSRVLLCRVRDLLADKAYSIVNTDISILAQVPKIAPYINTMKENLAEDMKLSKDDVNVKVTTTEKMGFVGRQEGIAVHAIVLLR